MPVDREWVQEKLKEIEHKREILRALLDCLQKWEEDVDWEGLSSAKQAALMALAEQSTDTLQHMIARLNADIRSGLNEISDSARIKPNGAGLK